MTIHAHSYVIKISIMEKFWGHLEHRFFLQVFIANFSFTIVLNT
jgi:hypothetical protein